jgi:hypothetical protein
MVQMTDTLVYDAARIAAYQADGRFDYNRGPDFEDVNLMEMLVRWLSRWLDVFLDSEQSRDVAMWILIAVFVAILSAAVYWVWRKRPSLFVRERVRPLAYGVEEENIYGIDFDRDLAAAVAAGDYRAAVRVLYLQTLRLAADRGWVDWQAFKTPTEYVCELKPAGLRGPFRRLTNHFLRVRYGNFGATGELFDAMRALQDELRKGATGEGEG